MVFEDRNREYGAYKLRKTNQHRLLLSFVYAVVLFIIVVSLYPLSNLIHPKIYDQDSFVYQVVNVDMTYDPTIQVQIKQTIGSSSASESIPQKIADDDQVIPPQKDVTQPSSGHSDSTNATNSGSGSTGTGNSDRTGEGNVGEIFGSADVNPQFPGGARAMQNYILENIHYPDKALSMNIRGTILVYVVIMSDGSLRDAKIVKGLHPELDEEVIKVVRSMPLWKPAMRKGVAVNVRCTIPVTVSSRPAKF